MTYTLKVHWTRHEAKVKGEPLLLADEMTMFIPADEVRVHAVVLGDDVDQAMSKWEPESYDNWLGGCSYDNGAAGGYEFANGRLISVTRDGVTRWLLASRAWLLGADGKTIERVAP